MFDYAGFQIITPVAMKNYVFWDIILFIWVKVPEDVG
jgi:hypothetical protein